MIHGAPFLLAAMLFAMNLRWSDEAKILGLFPLPGRSHSVVNSALVNALADRGHDMTVYSPFSEEYHVPNYKHVPLKKYTVQDMLNIICK